MLSTLQNRICPSCGFIFEDLPGITQCAKCSAPFLELKLPEITLPELPCKNCGVHKTSKINCLQGVGPMPTPIMIIGEAPGSTEEVQGVPFVGKAGKILDELLLKIGIARSDVFLDNVFKCRPPEHKSPTGVQVKKCLPHLEATLRRVKPKVIIALGGTALRALTDIDGIMGWRGNVLYSRYYDCYIVPTYHPSVIYRDLHPLPFEERRASYYKYHLTLADFQLALNLLSSPLPKPIAGDYKTITDPKEAIDCLQGFNNPNNDVAVDIETTGLNFQTDKIIGISLSNKSFFGRYLVWTCFDDPSASDALKMFLASDSKKILQNAKFDQKFLMFNGYPIQNVHFDTKLADVLVDENRSHSLKDMAYLYTDTGGYERGAKPSKVKNKDFWGDVPIETLGNYACTDADVTYRLYVRLKKEIDSQGLQFVFHNVVMPFLQVLVAVEYRGIGVDKGFLGNLKTLYAQKLQAMENRAKLFAGDPNININSGKQLSELLFTKLNLISTKKTKKTKSPSTDSEALEQLKDQHPIVPLILEYKDIKKLMSTYVEGLEDFISPVDGRVHTNYNQDGTVSGRISSSTPNLQNIPRQSEIKKIFVAPPDFYFANFDFSQIELRIMANYSGDANLIEAYKRGDDIHAFIAGQCFGDTFIKADPATKKELRNAAKKTSFGLIYGIGYKKLAKQINFSEEDSKKFMEVYFNKYRGVKTWMDRQRLLVVRDKCVKNVFGRLRRLPEINSDAFEERGYAERVAMNSPIQSTASDICLMAMVRIYNLLKNYRSKIVGQVHDSIMFEIHKDEVNLIPQIKAEMERPVDEITVPLVADVEVMDRWGGNKIEWEILISK